MRVRWTCGLGVILSINVGGGVGGFDRVCVAGGGVSTAFLADRKLGIAG